MKQRKLKLVIFYTILLCLTYAAIELISTAGYWLSFREPFSYSEVESLRGDLLQQMRRGPMPGGELGAWVIHPYYGFVTAPVPGWQVNKFGFFGQEDQIQPADPATLVVGVVGGSVATQLALDEYTGDALKSELEKIPLFQGKKINILDLGNGSFKQPQALFVVNDIISRGGHIDLLIALDGFNEIALPEAHGAATWNVKDGISPFYPQSWRQLVDSKELTSREQTNALAKAHLMADVRLKLASFIAGTPLRYSVTANLLWRLLDTKLAEMRSRYNKLAQEEPPLDPHSRLSNDRRAFLGPEFKYSTRRQLYIDVAKEWARSSILLNNIMVDQGGIYIHFLQPNQYVKGSKPLTDHEQVIAVSSNSLYRRPVETGYPYLEAAGQSLRNSGIWFEDLTSIFANERQELYKDNCCHVNKQGNAILARAIAAALARHFSEPANKNRPVLLTEVDLDDSSIFSGSRLRTFASDSSYQDGSKDRLSPEMPLAERSQ